MSMVMLPRRRFAAVLLAAFAALIGKSPPEANAARVQVVAEPQASGTSASSYCADSQEAKFLSLINSYRKNNGLASLKLSRTLGAAAEHHSIDMARNNYFSHTLKNGTSWSQNIRDHGYSASGTMAENIAAGNSSAQATFDQWRASSGHNRNMLN